MIRTGGNNYMYCFWPHRDFVECSIPTLTWKKLASSPDNL